jgi:DNA-binding NarL/FixJ family response regulator
MPKSILIADDHTATRKALHAALERVGFAVCAEAVDGVDAVEKASNASPDLILLDFRMPRLNGIESASILHQKLPSTPIVILTMFDVGSSVATASGVSAVISKSDGMGSQRNASGA